jgi:hypothetical protein
MSNNFKKIALGLLALVVLGLFGAFVSASNNNPGGNEVGRYVPIENHTTDGVNFDILDTKTGRVYFFYHGANVYRDYVKGAVSRE